MAHLYYETELDPYSLAAVIGQAGWAPEEVVDFVREIDSEFGEWDLTVKLVREFLTQLAEGLDDTGSAIIDGRLRTLFAVALAAFEQADASRMVETYGT